LKTLDSVSEKNYMFIKAYALTGIERSLTHITSYHFVFHTFKVRSVIAILLLLALLLYMPGRIAGLPCSWGK
jgi:hypothetical protein